nr:protein FAM234A [Pelodiscus sinensis]|eukprot:XP_006120224.1 protein FAM234A [Pelodiscus sinensis]
MNAEEWSGMDNKELEAEIHPLKREDGNAPDNPENCTEKEGACRNGTRLSQLSRWRTAAFFLSLFLCLIVVFAFSFIIPCPVRPVSQRTWDRKYSSAVTYKFLAVEDVNEDKVQDVIFVFKDTNGSSAFNGSCSDEGLSAPCAFVAAVSGTNGSTLWERPATEDLLWMECAIEKLDGAESPGCLVIGNPELLTAIDPRSGKVRWRQFNNFGANYTVVTPLLKMPDVDGDGFQDLMIFATAGDETKSVLYSGESAYYVLFYSADSLYGYPVKDLYSMATGTESRLAGLRHDPQWEKKIQSPTRHIPLRSSGDVRYLVKVPGRAGENLLVVKSDVAELLDGQTLDSLWTVNASHVLSEPVFGYYTPDAPHVVLESGLGPHRKKVMIIEGGSGAVRWEQELNSGAGSPGPATLHTADHRSVFLFWGEHPAEANDTVMIIEGGSGAVRWEQELNSGAGSPGPATLHTADHRSVFLFWGEHPAEANDTGSPASPQNLYLFHPSYPNALLELRNSSERIVAFDAVLFERSRHACYVLLTGPQSSEGPGWVSVAKRKLKEDVSGSRVIWLSQETGHSEQSIKDRIFRMRFSSQL